jgi:hypothetical protein
VRVIFVVAFGGICTGGEVCIGAGACAAGCGVSQLVARLGFLGVGLWV